MSPPAPRVVMFLYRPFDLDSRVEREARSLVASGYEVEVICLPGPDLPERETRDGYAIRRVSPFTRIVGLASRLAQSRAPRPIPGLAFRAHALLIWRAWTHAAFEVAKERPADVFIGHDLDGFRPAVRAGRRLGKPLVYDAHELYPDMAAKNRPDYELKGWIRYESRLIRHADLVFAVTASRAEEMRRRFGGETPVVLRNVPETAVDGEEPAPAVDLRGELGIDAGTRVLLYLGGLMPTRGLEEAIRALPALPGCTLVMMGSGMPAMMRSLEELALAEGVADRFFIRPPVRPHEVVGVAAQADVGLVLNHNVGLNNYLSLPNKIFESVAAGLPIVTSDFPDMAEFVNRHGVGETCDPEDPADIARAVRAVVGDADRLDRLRRNAAEAAPELTWERESEVFLSRIRELAGPR